MSNELIFVLCDRKRTDYPETLKAYANCGRVKEDKAQCLQEILDSANKLSEMGVLQICASAYYNPKNGNPFVSFQHNNNIIIRPYIHIIENENGLSVMVDGDNQETGKYDYFYLDIHTDIKVVRRVAACLNEAIKHNFVQTTEFNRKRAETFYQMSDFEAITGTFNVELAEAKEQYLKTVQDNLKRVKTDIERATDLLAESYVEEFTKLVYEKLDDFNITI